MNLLIITFLLLSNVLNTNCIIESVNITSWIELSIGGSADAGMVIGYDYLHDQINIIGGIKHEATLSYFDLDSEIYYGASGTHSVVARSQEYAQLFNSPKIYYDASDSVAAVNYANIENQPTTFGNSQILLTSSDDIIENPAFCLNSNESILYMIGLRVGDGNTIVREFDSNGGCTHTACFKTWNTTLPYPARRRASCRVYGDGIYVFGGAVNRTDITLNEIILCNITTKSCTKLLTNVMVEARANIQSVTIDNACSGYLVLIGGYTDGEISTSTVEVFNMDTHQIYQVASLNKPRNLAAAFYSRWNGRIWVFYGLNSSDQNSPLSTIEVTPLTNELSCTFSPTVDPTVDPTFDPTTEPTVEPTIYPTTIPTNNPTKFPTVEPTIYPTLDPTIIPTSYPSKNPSTVPTKQPSDNPTTPFPYETTSGYITSSQAGELEDPPKSDELPWWFYLIIGLLLLLCCCCFIFIFCAKKKKKEENVNEKYIENRKESIGDAVTDAEPPLTTTTGGKKQKIELAGTSAGGGHQQLEDIYGAGPATKGQKSIDSDIGDGDIYAKGNGTGTTGGAAVLTIGDDTDDSDHDVLMDGDDGVLTPKGNNDDLNKLSNETTLNIEGRDKLNGTGIDGDPAVTQGQYGGPMVTGGGPDAATAANSNGINSDDDDMYKKGKDTNKGHNKILSTKGLRISDDEDDDDDDDDLIYDKNNNEKSLKQSKGGPNSPKNQQPVNDDSDNDDDKLLYGKGDDEGNKSKMSKGGPDSPKQAKPFKPSNDDYDDTDDMYNNDNNPPNNITDMG